MTTEHLKSLRAAANEYVDANLVDLCKELVEYDDTGILGAGKVRTLWSMVTFAGSSAQALAIGMVNNAAVRKIAA